MDFNGYVSVSQVATLGSNALKYYTAEHANRGKMVHSFCSAHLELIEAKNESDYLSYTNREGEDNFLPSTTKNVEDWRQTCKLYGYDGYAESVDLFFDGFDIAPILNEKRLYHLESELTGKPDLIGTCYNKSNSKRRPSNEGEIGIIDFKTSVNYQKSWELQLAGYWILCQRNGINPSWAMSVRIRRNGKPPLINVVLDDHDFDNVLEGIKNFNLRLEECKIQVNKERRNG